MQYFDGNTFLDLLCGAPNPFRFVDAAQAPAQESNGHNGRATIVCLSHLVQKKTVQAGSGPLALKREGVKRRSASLPPCRYEANSASAASAGSTSAGVWSALIGKRNPLVALWHHWVGQAGNEDASSPQVRDQGQSARAVVRQQWDDRMLAGQRLEAEFDKTRSEARRHRAQMRKQRKARRAIQYIERLMGGGGLGRRDWIRKNVEGRRLA